jgi:transcriptional regulator with XRE-family HTH domain
MGRAPRPQPRRLAAKLCAIRTRLDLTQAQLIKRLPYRYSTLYPSAISEYEAGKREPPALVLLAYARLAGVSVETLIDDALDLPPGLPTRSKRVDHVRP